MNIRVFENPAVRVWRRRALALALGLGAALAVAVSHDALGQAARERGGGSDQALQKAQRLMRQLAQEKEALQSQNAELQSRVEELEAELDETKAALEETEAQLARARQDNQSLSGRLDATRSRLEQVVERFNELADRYRETARNLNHTTAERERWKQVAQTRREEIERCEAANDNMYQAGLGLLQQYEDKGVWDSLLQAEPFTGLKQVQVENVRQDYRDRFEANRYDWEPPQGDGIPER